MATPSIIATLGSSIPLRTPGSFMTTFSPPSYCSDVIKSSCSVFTPTSSGAPPPTGTPSTICRYLERDHTCGSDGYATRAGECFPNSPYPYSSLIYSPAIGCPEGWKTESGISLSPSQTTVPSETTAVCCPSGYDLHYYGSSCTSSISYTDFSTRVLSCSSGGGIVLDVITSTASTDYAVVWAPKMEFVLATPSSSELFITPPSEPTASNTTSGVSDPFVPPPEGKSGLGTGAIVGIVVGVVGALLLVGAFFFWRRRKQQHYHASIPKASPGGEHDALPEFVGGNGTGAPAQMTATSSNGLFQPQPELRSSR